MKKLFANLSGLACAVVVFSGSLSYFAANTQTATLYTNQPPPIVNIDDYYLLHEQSAADLLFGPQPNLQPDNSSDLTSSEQNNDNSSESSSVPSSNIVSSKKPDATSSKPASSKPTSTTPSSSSNPTSSVTSSAPTSSGQKPSNDLLLLLSSIVQREIVGTNTPPKPEHYEAIKAQAVATLSFIEYYKTTQGAYPNVATSTPHAKTIEIVSQVFGLKMYYQGKVIYAPYHAASGGYTQSSKYVWGGDLAYLKPVKSEHDIYESSYTISIAELQRKLQAHNITVKGDPSSWFDLANATLTDGGFINSIKISGTLVKGRKLREQILGTANLKSCKIKSITVSGNNIVFSTQGYGHGVGMSQYGALGYSANGWSYTKILNHYYNSVTIK